MSPVAAMSVLQHALPGSLGVRAPNSAIASQVQLAQRFLPQLPARHTYVTRRSSMRVSNGARGQVKTAARTARNTAQKKAAGAVEESGILQGLVDAHQRLSAEISWKRVLGNALLAGVTFGTVFQVTHNNGLLPEYDLGAFHVGPFLEAGTVPLLLAPIWVLYGYAQPLLDEYFADEAVDRASERASNLGFVALNWATLGAMFLLSDYLYLTQFPYWQSSIILAGLAAANWLAFDKTKGGLILAGLLAVGAPVTEMLIVQIGLWHYSHPDLNGIVHWTAWCYAAYTHGVGNVGRYLVQKDKQEA